MTNDEQGGLSERGINGRPRHENALRQIHGAAIVIHYKQAVRRIGLRRWCPRVRWEQQRELYLGIDLPALQVFYVGLGRGYYQLT